MHKVFYSDISTFSFDINSVFVLDENRAEYLKTITDLKRKKQSLLVWKLLEYALHTLGYSNLKFENKNGKWAVEKTGLPFISISHCENIICVAISDEPVGVDVEKTSEKVVKVSKKLFGDVCSENNELDFYTKCWTEWESQIKCENTGNFSSFTIFDYKKHKYILTVCSNNKLNGLEFIDLDKYI